MLLGWREATVDIDLKLVPDAAPLLKAVVALKAELSVNVELASPDQFIPVTEDWAERSPLDRREGRLTVRHYDLMAQAMAKLERGHVRDLEDVTAMLERGLVDGEGLLAYLDRIEPELYRFPAVDPVTLRRSVERAARGARSP